ncbi:anti-phage BREX system Lon protease BrxL, partial [Aliivibrio finisterrensis]
KGRVVRKDLTKQLKEGANVPVYVLEYLLGMYCSATDNDLIEAGMVRVKKILTDNYVRPDEAEKVKSMIRERGTHKVIDKISVKLNQKKDVYEASLSNLGIKDAVIPASIIKDNEKLLTGGIWCIVTLSYFFEEGQKTSPFSVLSLKAIQMPSMNMDEVFNARRNFSMDQWLDLLLRSIGMEPANLEQRAKWHIL